MEWCHNLSGAITVQAVCGIEVTKIAKAYNKLSRPRTSKACRDRHKAWCNKEVDTRHWVSALEMLQEVARSERGLFVSMETAFEVETWALLWLRGPPSICVLMRRKSKYCLQVHAPRNTFGWYTIQA